MRRDLTQRARIFVRTVYRMSSSVGISKDLPPGEAVAQRNIFISNTHVSKENAVDCSVRSTSAGTARGKGVENQITGMKEGIQAGESTSRDASWNRFDTTQLSPGLSEPNSSSDASQEGEPEACSYMGRTFSSEGKEEDSASQRDLQEAAVSAALADAPTELELFDAHCHLQLPPLKPYAHHAVALAVMHGVRRIGVCGTAPGTDWEALLALHEAHRDVVVPSFGLHPWWIARHLQQEKAERGEAQWAEELEELLRRSPAAHVGECGLDKAVLKDGVSYDLQEEVLRRHLRLAGRYRRALTLHCVTGCWDRLLALLRAEQQAVDKEDKEVVKDGGSETSDGTSHMPTAIILHSCNSLPKEMVHRFMGMRNVYFSISGGGRAGLAAKTIALASSVPSDRLLLETDSPDQLPAALRGCGVQHNEPALLRYHCGALARALGEAPALLAKRTSDNAARAYQLTVDVHG